MKYPLKPPVVISRSISDVLEGSFLSRNWNIHSSFQCAHVIGMSMLMWWADSNTSAKRKTAFSVFAVSYLKLLMDGSVTWQISLSAHAGREICQQ